jgi:isopentenyl-diphosphate delta-isomerase
MPGKDKLTSAQNLDELFDVVNAQDEVVAQATRREVHRRELFHRAVHVFVFGDDGRVFLQKRSMAKDRSPGLWDASCSGHVDAGEAYDAAASRELREEIGLAPARPPERWLYVEAQAQTGWEFIWVYRVQGNGPFVLHPAEIECGEWFTWDEISLAVRLNPERFTSPFRLIWARLCAQRELGGELR